jgi:hypothetical protein
MLGTRIAIVVITLSNVDEAKLTTTSDYTKARSPTNTTLRAGNPFATSDSSEINLIDLRLFGLTGGSRTDC